MTGQSFTTLSGKRSDPGKPCGYQDGQIADPLYPPGGFQCMFDPQHSLWATCPVAMTEPAQCGMQGVCIDLHRCKGSGCGRLDDFSALTRTCTETGREYCSTRYITSMDMTYMNMDCFSEYRVANYMATPKSGLIALTTEMPQQSIAATTLPANQPGQVAISSQVTPTSHVSTIKATSFPTSMSGTLVILLPTGQNESPGISPGRNDNTTAIIIGSVLGGAALLGVLGLALYFFLKTRREKKLRNAWTSPSYTETEAPGDDGPANDHTQLAYSRPSEDWTPSHEGMYITPPPAARAGPSQRLREEQSIDPGLAWDRLSWPDHGAMSNDYGGQSADTPSDAEDLRLRTSARIHPALRSIEPQLGTEASSSPAPAHDHREVYPASSARQAPTEISMSASPTPTPIHHPWTITNPIRPNSIELIPEHPYGLYHESYDPPQTTARKVQRIPAAVEKRGTQLGPRTPKPKPGPLIIPKDPTRLPLDPSFVAACEAMKRDKVPIAVEEPLDPRVHVRKSTDDPTLSNKRAGKQPVRDLPSVDDMLFDDVEESSTMIENGLQRVYQRPIEVGTCSKNNTSRSARPSV